MHIEEYNEEFTRYDDVVLESEEREKLDKYFAEHAVPVYLRQISESLGILCEYARQAIEIIDSDSKKGE